MVDDDDGEQGGFWLGMYSVARLPEDRKGLRDVWLNFC